MRLTDKECSLATSIVREYQAAETPDAKSGVSARLCSLMRPMVEGGAAGFNDTPEVSREDVIQDLYLVLLKTAEDFPADREDFVPWFGMAAKRELARIYSEDIGFRVPLNTAARNKDKGRLGPEKTSLDALAENAQETGSGRAWFADSTAPDPEDSVLREEMHEAIMKAIGRLGTEKQELLLSVMGGQDLQEIAFMTGETDYDLYRRFKAITKELRETLELMGYDGEEEKGGAA